MRMWQQLDFLALLDTLASLLLAFVLGSLVGLAAQGNPQSLGQELEVRLITLHGGECRCGQSAASQQQARQPEQS